MASSLEKTIADRFIIESHARSGGMGVVYAARDKQTGDKVALKLLSTTDSTVTERFLREAELLAEISHPAIVGHVAHGVDDDMPYLVMRWVPGKSIQEQLTGGGTLTIEQTLALGMRIAEALTLVHERGIVHRDVKPSNVILEDGRPENAVLLDFGIAHLNDGELTRTGELIGSPGYMSPEQAQGTDIDPRADIFALGCVLYRCLVGKSPFEAKDPLSAAVKVLLEDAPRLADKVRDIPPNIDDLVSRMLSRERKYRPENGADLVREIAAALDSPTIEHRTVPRTQPPGASGSGSIPVPSGSGSYPTLRTLGGAERRVISLVVARRADWEPTMAAIAAVREVLDELLEPLKMRASVLTDGSIVAAAHDVLPQDAVLRAARAALLIVEELPDATVAVTTGRGVIEGDDVPIGESVERAIELLERAESGIVVDQTSAGLLVGRFAIEERVEDEGTIRVLVGESRAGRTLLGKPSSIVGRTRELATLELMLDECKNDSVARAMLVTAEPGVGKSRLCSELLTRARSRNVRVWSAYGDPATRGSPLSMLAGLIGTSAEVQRGDSPKERRRKIVARATRLGCPAAADLLTEVVAPTPEDEASPELKAARRNRVQFATALRIAWESYVTAACKAGPLVIVLEDLHWADARTVELIDTVLGVARDLPLFVLALARPEVATAFPNLFASHGLQDLKLLGLTPRASAELVRATLGANATDAVTNAIVTRAQGNALFLEELIRAAAEGRDGTPETLVAMMDRRLSQLDAHARRVLRAVAVFGESAVLDGIYALVGGERSVVSMALMRLVGEELLVANQETTYTFRHALLREAAYATLTEEDRRLGHQIAAEWLMKRDDADPLVLAEHFLIGGDEAHAREFFYAAASAALAKNDLDATLAHAARVEALDPNATLLAGLRMMQAEASLWKDDPAAYAQAVQLLTLVPAKSAAWYRGAAGLLFIAGQLADFSRIVEIVGRLEDEGPADPDRECASMQIMAYSMAAWMIGMVGVTDRARRFYERAKALEALGDDEALGWLGVGGFYYERYLEADPWKAFQAIRTSRQKFALIGDTRLTTFADLLEGTVFHELGAYDEALPLLERTLVTCDRIALSAARGDCKRWLGMTFEALGRYEEALVMFEAAHKETKNALTYRGAAKAGTAAIQLALGRPEEARANAREASFELSFAPSHCAHALATLARAELSCGDKDAALDAANRAVAIVDALGAIGAGEAPVFVALAQVHEARGDSSAAARAVERGVTFVRVRATKIEDPKYRKSFEENVEANVWLLRKAR